MQHICEQIQSVYVRKAVKPKKCFDVARSFSSLEGGLDMTLLTSRASIRRTLFETLSSKVFIFSCIGHTIILLKKHMV